MSNLFISHSSRDNAAAKELQSKLEEQGHRSVFLDLDPEVGIQAGVSWERTLYTKLRACRAVVALCSDSYLNSQWCFAEIALARMEGKELFVLQIDPWGPETQMPSILTEEQFIDIRTNQEEGYQRLWNGFKVKGIVPAERRDWRPDDPPYPGLRAFQEEDAPIFFGRDAEILEGAELLNQIRRQGHPRLAMVLGSSGSGKSSLVRAGIVPQLRRDKRQWTIVRPFRPGQQPMRELSAALSDAFGAAGQAMGWEEIYRWLEPEDEGEPARAVSEAPPEVGGVLTPDVARERLLQALSVLEGELSAAGDRMMSSVHNLKDYLNQQQADDTRSLSHVVKLEKNALVDIGMRLRLAGEFQDTTVVLVIDQFEELLGHDADHPASRFLTMLRTALEVENSPFLTIGTMRSDFLGLLQASVPLQGLGRKSLSVGPMAREGMRQIIEEPAELGQIRLEDGLADMLLDDTATADALPLLAFTLRSMWDRYRANRLLAIREYKELGGLQGAVALAAEETYQAALDHQPDDVARAAMARKLRDAFLSMARPAAEGAGWSRQPVNWSDFGEAVQPLLEPFIDPQRLLVKREDSTVEVAHEALFRSWDRMRGWLDENAESLHLLHEIRGEAKKWNDADANSKAEYLWTGGRLARAQELRDGGVLALDNLGAFFIDASVRAERAAAEAEEAARQRELAAQKQRRNIFAGAFVVSLGLAAVAGLFYFQADKAQTEATSAAKVAQEQRALAVAAAKTAEEQRDRAEKQLDKAQITQARFLAGKALELVEAGDAGTAVALARWAMPQAEVDHPDGWPEIADIPEVPFALYSALHNLKERDVLRGHEGPVTSAAVSPDGARILTTSEDKTARLWDVVTKAEIAVLRGQERDVSQAAFSPDGRIVVTNGHGTVQLWNADNGAKIVALKSEYDLIFVAFSPNGTRIATYSGHGMEIWGASKGERIGMAGQIPEPKEKPDGERGFYSIEFSADGHRMLVKRKGISELWEAEWLWGDDLSQNFDPVRHRIAVEGHSGSLQSATFSPDGSRYVTASGDGVQVWDASTGIPIGGSFQIKGFPRTAEFSPDGERIIATFDDRTARILDVGRGREIAVLRGHESEVQSAFFSSDGTRIVTASGDHTVRIWEADGGKPMALLGGHEGPVKSAVFSRNGSRVISASDDGTVRIWGAGLGVDFTVPRFENVGVVPGVLSPDGTRAITALDDGTARIWDPATGAEIAVLSAHKIGSEPQSAAPRDKHGSVSRISRSMFSPKATRIVTFYRWEGIQRLWNTVTGEEIAVFGRNRNYQNPAFSPDDSRIVTLEDDYRTMRLWDAVSGNEIDVLSGHTDTVRDAAFSPDGAKIVTFRADDNTARVWDAGSGNPISEMAGHEGPVIRAVFTRDGNQLITASEEDGTARVWDVQTGDEIVVLSSSHTYWFAALSPDGTSVVTAAAGNTAQLLNTDTWKPIATLSGHRGAIARAAYSPDGTRIVTLSEDNTARTWDARTGAPISTLSGHKDRVYHAEFSRDSTLILTAAKEGETVRIWDNATGNPIAILHGKGGRVKGAKFSPDGAWVVTNSSKWIAVEKRTHGTVEIWDAKTGARIAALLGKDGIVERAEFSPDGTWIVTVTWRPRRPRLWRFPPSYDAFYQAADEVDRRLKPLTLVEKCRYYLRVDGCRD